jgi:hypothetical protein
MLDRRMKPTRRLVACLALAIAIAASGCTAQTLDAGSTSPARATTRATMSSMIDAITMDATDLYFTSEDGWLYRLAKTGTSAPVRIAPAGAPGSLYTEGIAVDDDHVYWTALGDGLEGGAVLRAPKAGGPADILAPHEARPWSIAIDGDSVVWAAEGGATPANVGGIGKGTIARLAKSGSGSVEILARQLDTPDFIAIDGDGAVVWHERRAIRRLASGSASPQTILSRPAPFRSTNLVVAADRVAWADDPAGTASVWTADAAGNVTSLATGIDAPASLSSMGATIFWNVATGHDVGAIHASAAGGDGAETILTRDAPRRAQDELALFLLADEHAFYSVVSWEEAKALTVEIRVVSR